MGWNKHGAESSIGVPPVSHTISKARGLRQAGESRNPEPGTRNPEPGTRNPEPGTRNSELGTRNAKTLPR